MNSENLYRAVGNIDEKFISEAAGLVRGNTAHQDLSGVYHSGEEGVIEVSVIRPKRNRMKILAIAVAAVAGAGIAAAAIFGTGKDKNEYKEKKIENYFREEGKIEFPGQIMYVEDVSGSRDALYIPARMIGNGTEEYFAGIYNMETGEDKLIELDEYGDYVYRICAGKNALYFGVSENAEITDGKSYLVRTDRNTGAVTASAELDENGWLAGVNESGDGTAEIIEYVLTDNEISEYFCITCDSSLRETGRKSLTDRKLLSEGQRFFGYLPEDDGEYYTFYRKDDDSVDMYKYSPDGELLYLRENINSDMPGMPLNMFMSAENRPVIMTLEMGSSEKDTYYFDEFDPETGEINDRFESEHFEFGYVVFADASGEEYEKYDFVFVQNGTVYGYEMRYDELTEICSIADRISASDGEASLNVGALSDSDVIFAGSTVAADDDWGMKIMVTDQEGSSISYINIPEGYNYRDICETSDGSVYVLISLWKGEEGEEFSVIKTDRTGNTDKITELKYSGGEKIHSDSLIVTDDGTIVTDLDYGTIGFFDSEGNFLGKCSVGKSYLQFFRSGSDCYVSYTSAEGSTEICRIDTENMTVSSAAVTDCRFDKLYDGFGEYDVVAEMNDGLYGYSVSTGKFTEIVNWLDSDLDVSEDYHYLHPFSEDYIVSCKPNFGTENNSNFSVQKIKRVGSDVLEKIQQRKIINIAVTETNAGLRKLVRKFNTENESARIHIEDYSKYAFFSNTYIYNAGGMEKLSQDIVSGRIPDMIIFGAAFDRERFCREGVFADLNEYIGKDSDISGDDFFESVLDAYSTDGRQYCIPLNFSLTGMTGRGSLVGDVLNPSYDRMNEISENTDLFSYLTYDQLECSLLTLNISDFIDYSAGTCSFDSGKFTDIINIIKKYGISDEEYDKMLYNPDESEWRKKIYDNKCAFDIEHLYSFDEYARWSQNYAPIDAVLTGLPDDENRGFTISSDYTAAVFRSSDCKDEVWSFLKHLLSEDSQISEVTPYDDGWLQNFPVRKSAFDAAAEIQLKSNNMENSYTNDCTGKQVRMRRVNNDDIEAVRKIISSARRSASADSAVQKIIDEQLELFIADAQTAEETAENVQRKVSIYLKEIK